MFFSQALFNLNSFEEELKSNLFQKAKSKFYHNIKSRSYEFLNDMNETKINEIYSYANQLKKNETVIFLGTGGSSLGGKTLVSIKKNFFKNNTKPQIFFLENVDEISINGLLEQLDMKKTSIVVISKSGETIETLAQFFMLKKKISKTRDYKKRIFVITENKNSTLKKIQEEEGFFLLNITIKLVEDIQFSQ